MFLPTTKEEIQKLGWKEIDVILVSGDSYIDSPYIGIAVIGKLLSQHGYKVAIIAQPNINSKEDITRLGEPKLFWGVSGGSVDSMVANYTALNKKRRNDDFTPGGENNKRPDRAVIAYVNLIKSNFKNTVPIVLGGIEASLRRLTHYDYWSDKLRRSILIDSKADYLIFGMGEKAVLDLTQKIKKGKSPENVKGLCYISNEPNYKYIQTPSFEECVRDKKKFMTFFEDFYHNNDPKTARGICQKTGERYLIQNPPQPHPETEEIDSYYNLNFERELHPYYLKQGNVKALDTIRFSINTHRGCYGECNFCAIAVHQGKTIISRSRESILKEVKEFENHKRYKGVISDVGGPTANMYDYECVKKLKLGVCEDKRCIFPDTCKTLRPDHGPNIKLLEEIENVKSVKKVFIASGIRYDLVTDDKKYGYEYIKKVITNHTSGQMKIAPEHTDDKVLELMGKPGKKSLEKFKDMFYQISDKSGKKQFLTYYFIAAHPGCSDSEMENLKSFTSNKLQISPEQVQVFTPTPSTYSSLMYYTGINPFNGERLFVEKNLNKKRIQKEILTEGDEKKYYVNKNKNNKKFKPKNKNYS
jgi:uncharacterized radical SAM protein YgiQ